MTPAPHRTSLKKLFSFSGTTQASIDLKGRITLPKNFSHALDKDVMLFKLRDEHILLGVSPESLDDKIWARALTDISSDAKLVAIDEGKKINIPYKFEKNAFGVEDKTNLSLILIGQGNIFQIVRTDEYQAKFKKKAPEDADPINRILEQDGSILFSSRGHLNEKGRLVLHEILRKRFDDEKEFLAVKGENRHSILCFPANRLQFANFDQIEDLAPVSAVIQTNIDHRVNLPKQFAESALRIPQKEYAEVVVVAYANHFEIWSPREWSDYKKTQKPKQLTRGQLEAILH